MFNATPFNRQLYNHSKNIIIGESEIVIDIALISSPIRRIVEKTEIESQSFLHAETKVNKYVKSRNGSSSRMNSIPLRLRVGETSIMPTITLQANVVRGRLLEGIIEVNSEMNSYPIRKQAFESIIPITSQINSKLSVIRNTGTSLDLNTNIIVYGIRRQEGSTLLRLIGSVDPSFMKKAFTESLLSGISTFHAESPFKYGFAIADLKTNNVVKGTSSAILINQSDIVIYSEINIETFRRSFQYLDINILTNIETFSYIISIGNVHVFIRSYWSLKEPFISKWLYEELENTIWETKTTTQTEWEEVEVNRPTWKRVIK